ncbi:MAG: hypothetical protein ACLGH3_09215 [Actinomycetota bacterium]
MSSCGQPLRTLGVADARTPAPSLRLDLTPATFFPPPVWYVRDRKSFEVDAGYGGVAPRQAVDVIAVPLAGGFPLLVRSDVRLGRRYTWDTRALAPEGKMRTYLLYAAASWTSIRSEPRVLVIDRKAPTAWIEPARQDLDNRHFASVETVSPEAGRTDLVFGPTTLYLGGSDPAQIREIKAVLTNQVTGERTVRRFEGSLSGWSDCLVGVDARDETPSVTCALRHDFSNAPGRYDLSIRVTDSVGNRTGIRTSLLALPCPRPQAEDAWVCAKDLLTP